LNIKKNKINTTGVFKKFCKITSLLKNLVTQCSFEKYGKNF